MEQIRNYGDARQVSRCAYCGGDTRTRDHVPSKVLLDEPYPSNLPVVPACESCNCGFSSDEEYLACLIDVVLAGETEPGKLQREKIRSILSSRPALAARLGAARSETTDGVRFTIEDQRVENVLLKLARGHSLYELNEPHTEAPSSFWHRPIMLLTVEEREKFETLTGLGVWPEVGSRAMQRLFTGGNSGWVVVQPSRYRYLTDVGAGALVRIVLSEYLACEVKWE